jgi:hypothetical protein
MWTWIETPSPVIFIMSTTTNPQHSLSPQDPVMKSWAGISKEDVLQNVRRRNPRTPHYLDLSRPPGRYTLEYLNKNGELGSRLSRARLSLATLQDTTALDVAGICVAVALNGLIVIRGRVRGRRTSAGGLLAVYGNCAVRIGVRRSRGSNNRVSRGLLEGAGVWLVRLGDGDDLSGVVVNTGRVLGNLGVAAGGVVLVDSGGGLDDGVLSSVGAGNSGGLHDGLGDAAVGLVRRVVRSDGGGLGDLGDLAAVCDGLVGLSGVVLGHGDSGRVGHSDVLGRDGVSARSIICGDLRLRCVVSEGVVVRIPLATLVLLDLDGLLVLGLLRLGVSSVAGESVRAQVVVGHLVDLLVELIPGLGLGRVGVGAVASWLSVTNGGGLGVGEGGLGVVDSHILVGLGDGDFVAIDISDDGRDGLVMRPFATLVGGNRLVLGSDSHWLLAVAGVDGGVSELGRAGGLGGSSVAVLGSDSGREREDSGGLHYV